MKLGFKKGFGSTAALGRSVGMIGRTVGSWPSRNGCGRMDSRSAGLVGRIEIWPMVSRPDVGRSFPARTDASAVVREVGCAAARPCSRLARHGRARRGVERLKLGRPRDNVSRVVLHDQPVGFELWPRLQSDGHDFSRFSASRTARFGR
ncbi:unnamed protein product [Microthlaspi erraticum]|uniref:Uncharacterized protein n=1 Tax=Microthlaspi erraticum TaxID=1685480 RepID=A0A6D2JXG3_9BRAS|nr:unnamed protein product [Microthlaspi erraticum]